MNTKNPRINVTLSQGNADILSSVAKNEKKSVSQLVKELAFEALEMREDIFFSKMADEIDLTNAKFISHDDAWA